MRKSGAILVALLPALLAGVGGCRERAPLDADAVAAYVQRRASSGDASGSGSSGDAGPAPTASRVRVTVVDGEGLTDGVDAYLVLAHRGRRGRTSTAEIVDGAASWGDSFTFRRDADAPLRVVLYDADVFADDRLGVRSRELPGLRVGAQRELSVAFGEGATGTVRLRVEGLE